MKKQTHINSHWYNETQNYMYSTIKQENHYQTLYFLTGHSFSAIL